MAEEIRILDAEELRRESAALMEKFQAYAKFYQLPPGRIIQEITQAVLDSTYTEKAQKLDLLAFQRRIFLFQYPSDGLKIKGLVSFVPDAHEYPTLVYLRGGNREFAITNPGVDFVCWKNYTVLLTTYRGGVSEGVDEYGGDDVNDVKNLVDFIPTLEKQLDVRLQADKMFLLGQSRGGMQMFLALSRFPELQTRFSKVVSLCGLLDFRTTVSSRADLKELFIQDFGLIEGCNEEEWIRRRDPMLTVNAIGVGLPILIIQGTDDNRVLLTEGYRMVNRLQETGHRVEYWEIPGGQHSLINRTDRTQLIARWLEGSRLR